MFFIVSKTLSFFLSPFNILVLLTIWWCFTKKKIRKKRIGMITIILFLFFSNPYIIYKITLLWQVKRVYMQPHEKFEAGILLTGFMHFEKTTGLGYFGKASDRFIQTVLLYKAGNIKKIMVTGGSGSVFRQQYKEADFVQDELVKMGIPIQDIIIENQSRNTFENAQYTKKVLDSMKINAPYLLITSATHMRRSQQVFNNQGIITNPYPCDYNEIHEPQVFWESIFPSYKAFKNWEVFLKESVGLLVYKSTGKA
jgi:uncharacterized SAM-binding protein YcdF (DUF218 family)